MIHRLRAVPVSFLLTVLVAALTSCASPAPASPTAPAAPTSTPNLMPSPQPDWLIVNVPANATQEQYGAEAYRLVCQDCHGDRGQGLTPEWRATWAPQDQNCWQSKCHGPSHPPDGFLLPIAPAIVGREAMAQFDTAKDLYVFIQAEMPWYRPGILVEKDAWAVTAHVLTLNHIDPGKMLDAQTASQIRLR